MIKNTGGQLLKTRSAVLHPRMPKQDKKNAATCIFEPPLCADNPRETRGIDKNAELCIIEIK